MKLIMESFNSYLKESDTSGALNKWLDSVEDNKEKKEDELNEGVMDTLFQIMMDGVAYTGLAELVFGLLAGIAKKQRRRLKLEIMKRQKRGDKSPIKTVGSSRPDEESLVEALSDFFTEARRGAQTLFGYTALKAMFGDKDGKLAKWVDLMTLVTALISLANDGILDSIQQKLSGKGGVVGVIEHVFSSLTTGAKSLGGWLNNIIKAIVGAMDTKAAIKLSIGAVKGLFSDSESFTKKHSPSQDIAMQQIKKTVDMASPKKVS